MISLGFDKNEYIKKYSEKYNGVIKDESVQNYLNITMTLASIAIFVGFAIRPSLATIIKLKNEINEYEVLDQKLSEKIINLSTANTLQDEYASDIILLDKAIPKISDESNILKILNYLAIKNNMAFSSISNKFTKSNNYQTVEMTLQLKGTYASVLTFLSDIKEVLRIINMQELKMDIIDNHGQNNDGSTDINKLQLLEITVKANTYYELDNNSTSNPPSDNLNKVRNVNF